MFSDFQCFKGRAIICIKSCKAALSIGKQEEAHRRIRTGLRTHQGHSSFSNSSGMVNSGFWKSWCAPCNVTKKSMELFQSTKITFCVINNHVPFSFTDSTNRCNVILDRSDVESFWGLWNSSMDVLVILVRTRYSKARIPHASTINKRTMTRPVHYLSCSMK